MEKNDSDSNRNVYQPLNNRKSVNLLLNIQHHWSPPIEKEIIAKLNYQVTKKGEKNQERYINRSLFLFVIVLGLLSFGLCIQADAIAQILREAARMSVESVISID